MSSPRHSRWPDRTKVLPPLSGFLISGFLVALTGTVTAGQRVESIGYQSEVQLGLALLMFGYYLGITVKTGAPYSEFLAGFLSGSLLFGVWLLGYNGSLSTTLIVLFVIAAPAGITIGIQNNLFDRRRLGAFAKYILNGGLWSFQGYVVTTSVFNSPYAGGLVSFVILVLAALFQSGRTQVSTWVSRFGRREEQPTN